MKNVFTLILLSVAFMSQMYGHSGKPKYHIIIDTDGAIDDMRAISMFLSGNDIRVLAITCSQGSLSPSDTYLKVKSLLDDFYAQGIPVAMSHTVDYELPVWNSFAKSIKWGKKVEDTTDALNSIELLNKITKDYPFKITLIALGSLKTYADWLKANPKIKEQIKNIIWYNSIKVENGFNYKVSLESYDFFKESGIPLVIIENKNTNLFINQYYLNELENCNSVYAQQILKVHKQSQVAEKIKQKHLVMWDDIVPLYMTVPMFFETEQKESITYVSINNDIPQIIVFKTIAELLVSATKTNNRVFVSFPIDTSLYKIAYARILDSTIKKFGLIEWKAIAMTNEVHGHTGIYSIIGAKMGVRAMEYFNVGVNNMYVTTFAGHKPPLSCFNDGVQISTGCTIGQGLITVSDSISNIPSAIFEFNNQKILVSVKKDIALKMRQDIKHGVATYGLLTPKYWTYIEDLAIHYWADFDRHEIFDIKKLD